MAQGYAKTRLWGNDGTADRTLLTDSSGRLATTDLGGIISPSPTTQAVATDVLKVFGASAWTGADANVADRRTYTLTNCGDGKVYARTVDAGDPDTVSTSDYEALLYPTDRKSFLLLEDQELQVVSDTSANVCARMER